MQKGGGCKTDWRWEGKCSSPGGCCKGGRRKSRRKRGRGTPKASQKKRITLKKKKKAHGAKKADRMPAPAVSTTPSLARGEARRQRWRDRPSTLTRPPSGRTPSATSVNTVFRESRGRPSTLTHPPSGRTVSTVSGNTAFRESLEPRNRLQAIIGAGAQGQTEGEYRRRIAAVVAGMPGRAGKRASAPRMVAQESYPDLLDYHRTTMGEDLVGNQTFRDVLMKPKLRKWEGDVKNDEAKKQWKKDLKLKPIPQPKFAVWREQYGGKRRRTRRRKRSRYGGNNNLQIDDDFVKYHDFLNKRLPEGLLAPRWKPGELASHTVISPDSNRTTIKKKRRKPPPPPPPSAARREAQALRAATIPIGDFEGNHLDLDLSAGKKAAKNAARRQRLKRWAAENAAEAKKKKKTSRRLFSPQEKRLIAAGAPEGGRRRRRRTRRRKRRGGEFANNVRGHDVSKFNSALAEKEYGPAKEPIKRDMITLERKKKYDEHIASLKPKDWRNMWGLFGGGRRRTRKQRGGEIQKLTATDMMRSNHILGHKINAIIDVVNQHHQSAGTGGTGGMRKMRRKRRRRRKKSRKSVR